MTDQQAAILRPVLLASSILAGITLTVTLVFGVCWLLGLVRPEVVALAGLTGAASFYFLAAATFTGWALAGD